MLIRLLAGLFLSLFAGATLAQGFPSRPLRLVVPFPAGGPTDLMGRLIAEGIRGPLGQPVVVENRAGASGNVGTDHVAKSAPDGHTLLLSGASSLAVNVTLFANLPYDPRRDFTPITKVVDIPTMLVVPAASSVRSIADLLRFARERPGTVNYASPTSGTINHLLGEYMRANERLDIVHVPYKGNPAATEALLRGDVHFMFDNLSSALPHWRAGKLRALGVTGSARVPAATEVPTLAEQGYPGYEGTAWFAVLAPAGLAPEVQARLGTEIVRVLRDAEFARRVEGFGMRVDPGTPAELAALIERDIQRWGALVRSSGARAD
ncbi:MAG: tripartite tricarboxylate transporter substrate binding protein [Burkholderiales bacterium]|nr:tripartite tricarboxylate transporter substrate binding protein [Burkholderiales bacterium]